MMLRLMIPVYPPGLLQICITTYTRAPLVLFAKQPCFSGIGYTRNKSGRPELGTTYTYTGLGSRMTLAFL
jgi:hypothetical protein